MNDLPIACTLTAADVRARQGELLPGLIARAEERGEIADGYRWRFTPSTDLLAAIAGVIEAERNCCQFLRFQMIVESGLGPVWLEITGPPGSREFLQELGRRD